MLASWKAEDDRRRAQGEGKTHLEPSWREIYHQTIIEQVKAEPAGRPTEGSEKRAENVRRLRERDM